MEEGKDVSSGKGVIPYFFYDVISFIIPGSCLLIGGFLIWFGQKWSEAFYLWMTTGGKIESSIAATSVLTGILFILFLGVSSFVGFLLSALSYQIVEGIWSKRNPYTMTGLKKFVGCDGQEERLERLKQSFMAKFGLDLDHCDLNKTSNICAYYIWGHNPILGTITARFDAEKILSQSLILVSILLSVVDVAHYLYATSICDSASPCVFLIWLVCLLLCMFASLFAFKFHREKRVYGRYHIFLALVAEDDTK